MTDKFGLTGFSMLLVLAALAVPAAAAPHGPSNVPRFAYVANQKENTVSIYTVNAATGQLRHNGYVATGTGPRSVTVDPLSRFAYVTTSQVGVFAYTINTTTGALTAVAGSPFATGANPTGRDAPGPGYHACQRRAGPTRNVRLRSLDMGG
jgi:DNA-binding beta-propeller fold protein YncE